MIKSLAITATLIISPAMLLAQNTYPIHKDAQSTYYTGGGVFNSCGIIPPKDSYASTHYVALNATSLNDDYEGGSACGQWIEVTANDKTSYAQVLDSCNPADGAKWCTIDPNTGKDRYPHHVDLAPQVVEDLGLNPADNVKVSWKFVDNPGEQIQFITIPSLDTSHITDAWNTYITILENNDFSDKHNTLYYRIKSITAESLDGKTTYQVNRNGASPNTAQAVFDIHTPSGAHGEIAKLIINYTGVARVIKKYNTTVMLGV